MNNQKEEKNNGVSCFWKSNVLIRNYLVFSFEIFVHILLEILYPSLPQNKRICHNIICTAYINKLKPSHWGKFAKVILACATRVIS